MTDIDGVDPELLPMLTRYLIDKNRRPDMHDIQGCRREIAQLVVQLCATETKCDNVLREDRRIPRTSGSTNIEVRIFRPKDHSTPLPALLWIHGGGYVMGDYRLDDFRNSAMAERQSCIVVSVDYQLAPEHPYPAGLEDCFSALTWLFDESAELGVDQSRVAIGGSSAGGGLTAALALYVRDKSDFGLAGQLLLCPMLDDRNIAQASKSVVDALAWNRESNLLGWRAYLGSEPGGDDRNDYSSPSRATDLTGLPPAYVAVGSLDLFADEDMDYARRLLAAGVPTELHVYAGGFHGFDNLSPNANISRRYVSGWQLVLERWFALA